MQYLSIGSYVHSPRQYRAMYKYGHIDQTHVDLVGIAIAMLVLRPEAYAAVRAARANRLQSSLNLALGSALASIGITIPKVAAIAIFFNLPLSLGIRSLNMTLMYLSFFIRALTLSIGKTTLLQGVVCLIIFFEFLFLSLVP